MTGLTPSKSVSRVTKDGAGVLAPLCGRSENQIFPLSEAKARLRRLLVGQPQNDVRLFPTASEPAAGIGRHLEHVDVLHEELHDRPG